MFQETCTANESTSLTNDAISVINNETSVVKRDIDSQYIREYRWPENMTTDSIQDAKPKLEQLFRDAEECFVMHSALVKQISEDAED